MYKKVNKNICIYGIASAEGLRVFSVENRKPCGSSCKVLKVMEEVARDTLFNYFKTLVNKRKWLMIDSNDSETVASLNSVEEFGVVNNTN